MKGKEAILAVVLCIALPFMLGQLLSPDEKPETGESISAETEAQTQETTEETQVLKERQVTLLKQDGSVETLPLESYLAGVILGELPGDFQLETMKALAVAARTLAIKGSENPVKHPQAAVCLNCGGSLTGTAMAAGENAKSKMAAGLLGIFLGGLGIHNFYLGYTKKAVAQLLICLFQNLRPDSLAFAADHHSHSMQLCPANVHGRITQRCHANGNLRCLTGLQNLFPGGLHHFPAEHRTHAGPDNLMVEHIRAALQQHQRNIQRIRCPENGAQISRVLNSIQNHHTATGLPFRLAGHAAYKQCPLG